MHKTTVTTLAALGAIALTPMSSASAQTYWGGNYGYQAGYPQNTIVEYRRSSGPRYVTRDYNRRYYGHRYSRDYDRRSGAGVAAGVIGGLAAGALIGGAIAAQQAPAYGYGQVYSGPVTAGSVGARGNADWIAYCSQNYRSFDPATGTYLGYDGKRHMCR